MERGEEGADGDAEATQLVVGRVWVGVKVFL